MKRRPCNYLILFPTLCICIVGFWGCSSTNHILTERQRLAFSSAKTVDLYYPIDYVNENEKEKIKSLIIESGREIVSEHKQDIYKNNSAKKLISSGLKSQVDKKEQEEAIRHGKKYVPENKEGDICIFFFSSLKRNISEIYHLDAFHKQINVCGKEYEGGVILSAAGVPPYESSGSYSLSHCSGTPPRSGLSMSERLQKILLNDIVPFLTYKGTVERWPVLKEGDCRIVVFYPRNKNATTTKKPVNQKSTGFNLSDQFEFGNSWKVKIPDGSFIFMDMNEGHHKMKYGNYVLDVQAQAGRIIFIKIANPISVVKEEDAMKELELLHHGFKNALPLNNQGG
jgi:hypothetical protein